MITMMGWLCCPNKQPSPLPPDKDKVIIPEVKVEEVDDKTSVVSVSLSDSVGSLMEDSCEVFTGIFRFSNTIF